MFSALVKTIKFVPLKTAISEQCIYCKTEACVTDFVSKKAKNIYKGNKTRLFWTKKY